MTDPISSSAQKSSIDSEKWLHCVALENETQADCKLGFAWVI